MLMVAGKYQYKKGVPVNDDLIELCYEKIQEWKSTF